MEDKQEEVPVEQKEDYLEKKQEEVFVLQKEIDVLELKKEGKGIALSNEEGEQLSSKEREKNILEIQIMRGWVDILEKEIANKDTLITRHKINNEEIEYVSVEDRQRTIRHLKNEISKRWLRHDKRYSGDTNPYFKEVYF